MATRAGRGYRRFTADDGAGLHRAFARRPPRRDPHVRFAAVTHPLITHPYHPDLVSGAGVTRMSRAAEAAGFHGYGFTDHPAPTDRWLKAGGHDALDPFVALGFAAAVTDTLAPHPEHRGAAVPEPVHRGQGGGDPRHALGRAVHPRGRRRLPRRASSPLVGSTTASATSSWTRRSAWCAPSGPRRGHRRGRHVLGVGASRPTRARTEPHPPIWIGGNSGKARQRVADHGDGWCPFPAPAIVATTARTRRSSTPGKLAEAIDDLRRRLDVVDATHRRSTSRSRRSAGGDPSSDSFDADALPRGSRGSSPASASPGCRWPPRRLGRARHRGRAGLRRAGDRDRRERVDPAARRAAGRREVDTVCD